MIIFVMFVWLYLFICVLLSLNKNYVINNSGKFNVIFSIF